ncbi:hypothetical protein [Actinomadura sp. 3N508]|uniref:hypothetical protein n=1 Tax=Actinomadura sp. 3N508 TaxID=3375153 RepID=UPI003788C5E8
MGARIERALPPAEERAAANERMRDLLTGPEPGPMAERLAVLRFTGRRTGRRYELPVGVHSIDDIPVIATSGGWRHNFADGAGTEIIWRGARRTARLVAVTDPDRTARGYLELYRRYEDAAERRLGITVTGDPDLDAFRGAVDRCGLSLLEVRFDTEGDGASDSCPSHVSAERTSR